MSSKLDEITVLPFGEIIHDVIREMGKLGNMPGQPVPLPEFYSALRARIQRTGNELLSARTGDEVAAAKTKLELLQKEEGKLVYQAKITAIEGLLQQVYVCLAFLDGQKVVVPSAHFAGDVDWKNESLRFAEKHYTRLRLVRGSQLSPELIPIIRGGLSEKEASRQTEHQTVPPTSTGAPGRPTSMHLVEAEFRRRAEENLTASTLKAESEILVEWLKDTHPRSPQATPKTIKNRIRHEYNALKPKESPQLERILTGLNRKGFPEG